MTALNHTVEWTAGRIPPVMQREPLVLRVTYVDNWSRSGYRGIGQVQAKLYVLTYVTLGGRQAPSRLKIATLTFPAQTGRVQIEPHVLRYLDVIAIRFGVTIKEVHWWGEKGKRKGDYELD